MTRDWRYLVTKTLIDRGLEGSNKEENSKDIDAVVNLIEMAQAEARFNAILDCSNVVSDICDNNGSLFQAFKAICDLNFPKSK